MILLGRRRRLLIDRMQYKLLGINLLYLCMITFLFLAAVFAPVIVTLYQGQSFEEEAAAAEEFLSLHKRIWPAVPLALLLVSLHSILVSHRIAGPLYRFRNVFGAIAKGDLSVRAGVRKRDYLERDSRSINEMIDGLTDHVGQIRRSFREVQTTFGEVQTAAVAGHGGQLAESIGRLDCRLGRLEERLARIRLPELEATGEANTTSANDAEAVMSIAEARR